ncbi:unnamed protein product [Paramecium pentaurelia]|uniref:Uncharacterized protein n=1 Tax=Paramecium pentaurelia TaxID=43138 RepID=A0A8S1V4B3_9CILI|nr:unnamed protein product [Paramecium pentaurelia]
MEEKQVFSKNLLKEQIHYFIIQTILKKKKILFQKTFIQRFPLFTIPIQYLFGCLLQDFSSKLNQELMQKPIKMIQFLLQTTELQNSLFKETGRLWNLKLNKPKQRGIQILKNYNYFGNFN